MHVEHRSGRQRPTGLAVTGLGQAGVHAVEVQGPERLELAASDMGDHMKAEVAPVTGDGGTTGPGGRHAVEPLVEVRSHGQAFGADKCPIACGHPHLVERLLSSLLRREAAPPGLPALPVGARAKVDDERPSTGLLILPGTGVAHDFLLLRSLAFTVDSFSSSATSASAAISRSASVSKKVPGA